MTEQLRLISSRDNPDYRQWLRLADGRQAHRDTRVILEGENLCRAWLEHMGPPPVLMAGESDFEQGRSGINRLWQACSTSRRVILQDQLAASLSRVRHGAAIFFLVETPRVEPPGQISRPCLWLDRVQDPGNVGTLMRTAAAAGLQEVYLSKDCARAWSPKVLRSAQGAHFVLRVHEQLDLRALLSRLEIPLFVTALDGCSIYEADLRTPCAWVMGNEGQGVDHELVQAACKRLRIPQSSGVESMNVAAAAAICLFEQRRQLLHV